jgi:hypothetical protein
VRVTLRRALCTPLTALGLAVAHACWPTVASAQTEASRVVLVRDRTADPVVDRARVRLAAELRAAGFVVEERVVGSDDDARKIVEEGADDGPFATVLLRRSGARTATDVWVSDHVTHKTVVRRMGSRGTGDAGDRALALRVVELMRASLVEGLVLPPPEPEPAAPPPPPPPPDVTAWTREAIREPPPARPAHVSLAIGVAGAFASPDVGPAVGPELRVAWRASETWSLGVVGVGPAFGPRVAGTEGTASVRQELALGEVAFEPARSGALSAIGMLGAGVYHLYASGDAVAPYTSGSDQAWAAVLSGGLGVRLRLSHAAFVVVDARELLALPRPVILFAGQRIAESMHPGTLAGLSLAVEL